MTTTASARGERRRRRPRRLRRGRGGAARARAAAAVSLLALCGRASCDLAADTLLNVSYAGNAVGHCLDGLDPLCTPALRVTPSSAMAVGAVWAREPVPLSEAWSTEIAVRMTMGGSSACPVLDESSRLCVQRGGHGVAVVLQDAAADPLTVVGQGGREIGYGGVSGALAVEFDTWYDPALGDLYDNHVGVEAAGPAAPLTASHRQGLAVSAELPDLGDGESHTLRVVYAPVLDRDVLHPELCAASGSCDRLQSTPKFAELLAAGMGDFAPVGSVSVYVDGAAEAVVVAPVNLEWAVARNSARAGATLGITAATGDVQWQSHDVERWTLCLGPGNVCRAVFVP